MKNYKFIELFKMQETQWIIKRQNKTYPIKNLESLFVYLLAFNVKMRDIEYAVIKMNREHLDCATFKRDSVKLEKK